MLWYFLDTSLGSFQLFYLILQNRIFSHPMKFRVEEKQVENRSETHYTNGVCVEISSASNTILTKKGLVRAELTALWSVWSLPQGCQSSWSVWTTLSAQGGILGMPCVGSGVGFDDLWVPPSSGYCFDALCFDCVSSSVTGALPPSNFFMQISSGSPWTVQMCVTKSRC